MSQLGQFCHAANAAAAGIKTENGYNDCMLALDYATASHQNKVGEFKGGIHRISIQNLLSSLLIPPARLQEGRQHIIYG